MEWAFLLKTEIHKISQCESLIKNKINIYTWLIVSESYIQYIHVASARSFTTVLVI